MSQILLLKPKFAINVNLLNMQSFYALSGNFADVQATCDQAANFVITSGFLAAVYIPSSVEESDGKWHWNGQQVTTIAGVSIFGASYAGCEGHENNWKKYIASTIIHNDAVPTSSYKPPSLFVIDAANGKPTRISGIQFETAPPVDSSSESTSGYEARSAIDIINAPKNFRVDHCTFINFCYANIVASSYSSATYPVAGGYGLVDHCVIDMPYKDTVDPLGSGWWGGYGIVSIGNMRNDRNNWVNDVSQFAGKFESIQDSMVIIAEDCHFSRCRHDVDGSYGGVMVVRYCLTDNPPDYYNEPTSIGQFDAHGSYTSVSMASAELLEIYHCTITGRPGYKNMAIKLRGGHGIFWGNIYNTYRDSEIFAYFADDAGGSVPEMCIDQTYIWGNSGNWGLLADGPVRTRNFPGWDLIKDDIGDNIRVSDQNIILVDNTHCATPDGNTGTVILNENYFLREPAQELDGWSYTPVSYPLAPSEEEEETTPFLQELEEGDYEISPPSIITDGLDTYNFKQWENGSTSPTRTISLTSDMSLMATYELAVPETATLRGIVRDSKTSQPIADADVVANGANTKTLQDGTYEIASLEPKQYTVTISKAGYSSQNVVVDATAGGTINIPDIELASTLRVSSIAPLTIGAILIIGSTYL